MNSTLNEMTKTFFKEYINNCSQEDKQEILQYIINNMRVYEAEPPIEEPPIEEPPIEEQKEEPPVEADPPSPIRRKIKVKRKTKEEKNISTHIRWTDESESESDDENLQIKMNKMIALKSPPVEEQKAEPPIEEQKAEPPIEEQKAEPPVEEQKAEPPVEEHPRGTYPLPVEGEPFLACDIYKNKDAFEGLIVPTDPANKKRHMRYIKRWTYLLNYVCGKSSTYLHRLVDDWREIEFRDETKGEKIFYTLRYDFEDIPSKYKLRQPYIKFVKDEWAVENTRPRQVGEVAWGGFWSGVKSWEQKIRTEDILDYASVFEVFDTDEKWKRYMWRTMKHCWGFIWCKQEEGEIGGETLYLLVPYFRTWC